MSKHIGRINIELSPLLSHLKYLLSYHEGFGNPQRLKILNIFLP
ncbi:hypothetical protein Nhal_3147 [Nitrosococcus halophilus Nc 4]|uniref:Uncharacterized protein n=1 Tax=Nitrosococcus halophilus (strain Nc4) TaxID=472759 RepID=D5BZV2_NITHN|nr:hypothetical protein Nhal_3147 [Nitrosococcus halophilus Nc 4]